MSTLTMILGALMAAESRADAQYQSDPNATRLVQDNPRRRAVLAVSALPLMGRYADDDGPLDRAPSPVPQGNRRQRRAQAAKR